MSAMQAMAPGKLNLCLHLGPVRSDGLHALVSLFDSVSLADRLTVRPAEGPTDRAVCPGVPGENIAERALRSAREAGLLDGPPLELTIEKQVPVAAGMGGGSADAAATLRLVAAIGGHPLEQFTEIAFALGADVPSQLRPGPAVVYGAGEHVEPVRPERLAGAADRAYVIIEQPDGLSTAEVFAQADRTGLPLPTIAPDEEALLERIAGGLDTAQLCELVTNSFEPAIVALRPELAGLPRTLREQGALAAAFTGSGPTSFGIFADVESAEATASELRDAGHLAHAAVPVGEQFAAPRPLEEPA